MPCVGPDRVPVADALGVVPHPVAVDELAAGRLGDPEHAPVDVGRDAGDHVASAARRAARASCARTRSWLPPMPPDVTITACARSSNSPTTASRLRLAARATPSASSTVAAHAGRRRRRRPTSSSTRWRKRRSTSPRAAASRTRRTNGSTTPGPGAPGDVEARDRVAVPVGAVAAALGPADDREEPQPLRVQPGALLAGGELDVGLGPAARPRRPRAGRTRRVPEPVLPGELERVLDAASAAAPGESTRNSPPNDQNACPPSDGLGLLVEQEHRAGRRRPARRWRPGRPARRRRRSHRLRRAHGAGKIRDRTRRAGTGNELFDRTGAAGAPRGRRGDPPARLRRLPGAARGHGRGHDPRARSPATATSTPPPPTATRRRSGRRCAPPASPREDVFVTTKCFNDDHGFEAGQARAARQPRPARARLRGPLPDPLAGARPGQLRGDLEGLRSSCRRRAWRGRSACRTSSPPTCERLIAETGVTPAVNQVELHPRFQQAGLRREHEDRGIVTEAWSPLAQGEVLDDPVITAHRRGARAARPARW